MGNKATFVPFAVLIAVIAVPLLAYAWYEHRRACTVQVDALREASRLLKRDIQNDIAQTVNDALERISMSTVTPDDDVVIHELATPLHQEQELPVFDKREYLDLLNGLVGMVSPQPPTLPDVTPHAMWKCCHSCGMYTYTARDVCDEPTHTIAMPLTHISDRELARVMTFLGSDVARREVQDEQARRAMGAFLLQLESVFGVWFEAQAVFDVFDMADEEQQMFFCFLHDYLEKIDYEHLGIAQQRNVRVQGSYRAIQMHNIETRKQRGILLLWQLDKVRQTDALQKVQVRDAE